MNSDNPPTNDDSINHSTSQAYIMAFHVFSLAFFQHGNLETPHTPARC